MPATPCPSRFAASRARRALPLALALVLAACGKASETVAEKAIEAQLQKDGQKAQVDLSGSTAKVTISDASGQTSRIEVGGAKVTEAEIGLPFYPGASLVENASSKVSSPEGTMATVQLNSRDAPDKVAAFYREQLRSRAQGKATFADMSTGEGAATLMLGDEDGKSGWQVSVSRADAGSAITIVASRAPGR
jgi:hypothetical protein